MMYLWIETDEFQVSAIQGNERRDLPVLRGVWSCRGRFFEPGARFPLTKATFPHKVGHATSTTRNLVFVRAIDPDSLWVNFVTLCAFDLERFEV